MDKSDKKCDHTSVGMIVWRDGKILLLQRRKFPSGFAPPAGHVDNDATFEIAAKRELEEEVGLKAKKLELLAEKDIDNPCSRSGGIWHHWKVYQVETDGEITRSASETITAGWFTLLEVRQLAERTEAYLLNNITEKAWEEAPGLESVWFQWFIELGII